MRMYEWEHLTNDGSQKYRNHKGTDGKEMEKVEKDY